MIHLTESASDAIRNSMAGAANASVQGIRIKIEAGGCAGFKYMMALARAPESDDAVVEKEGLKIFVEANSVSLLKGTTIDFVTSLEESGFTFDNPNAGSKCSCGKSFN
ncbi:MAG: iron-sulfur cluster assembly accessory protein [Zymomonas mobilis]|uniref:Iron-sulfur cluster assembly accessory protein n=1 Tax=Zymomonas mobilis TaxID=542 RepID=A0A542W3C9_ZYMMB|nr:iron-sulfur cluster assembly accessory protein [Zymomonas mobilis]TQL18112.1 iron-sulfur cluster assembly accessory protein [Zymomonas mobilis]